ncbi:DMT family transporter [Alcaligenaceae bacterium CGII-47]|nr:DMT family transporter [Alcaligenaceae bacterium CGII-47]
MTQKLTPSTVLLLLVPPLMWAGNAVVGRAVYHMVPPLTLNFLRWALAALLLLPMGYSIFRRGSGLWTNWRRYALLGLLGVGLYNSLQYLALHTSSPLNVTLVAASMPVWMLLIGRIFYGAAIHRTQIFGSVLSLVGVLIILAQGQWSQLRTLHFVAGDLLMIAATIFFAFYSWQLTLANDSQAIRRSWATLLLAQVVYGVVWSGAFAAVEWGVVGWDIDWGWGLGLALVFVAVGPAVIAFRCWGIGVQRVGPTTAGFFVNLTPLFAALLSLLMLGDRPRLYHAFAFGLIVFGIVLSGRNRG